MKTIVSNSTCPSCLQPEGIEHIEAPSVEDRLQANDRRQAIDLAYLSLIAFERRHDGRDRRAASSNAIVVEHHEESRLVCLHCTHEWEATDDSVSASTK